MSGRNQGSVCSLHLAVRRPSQSMSMSAFQKTAPFAPQTGTVAFFYGVPFFQESFLTGWLIATS